MANLLTRVTRRLVAPVLVSTVVLCAMIVYGASLHTPIASAQSTPQIIVSPSFANLSIGDTFTMTINLTDFQNLFVYQVVFKYDGRVLNLTNLWFPDDFVFGGQTPAPISVWSNDTEAAGDVVDHLNYTVAGSSLFGETSVTVTNGVLCAANFTVVGFGQTTIDIATKNNPAHAPQANWYTFFEDQTGIEYDDFGISTGSVLVVPEFTTIVLVMALAIIGTMVLMIGKKRALLR